MANYLAKLYLRGNKDELISILSSCLKKNNLDVTEKDDSSVDYLVSIIHIDNSARLKELIEHELNEISKHKLKLSLVISLDSPQPQTVIDDIRLILEPYLTDRKINLRVILSFDLYSHDGETPISLIESKIIESKINQKIESSQRGNNLYFPTSTSDLCDLILKSLFITNTAGNIYIGITEEITDLELAYLLKKNLEKGSINLEINMVGKEYSGPESLLDQAVETQALLNWIPKQNFTDAVGSILDKKKPDSEVNKYEKISDVIENPKIKPKLKLEKLENKLESKGRKLIEKIKNLKPESKTLTLHQKEERGFKKIIFLMLASVLILVALPFLVTISSLYFSTKLTYQSFERMRLGNSREARNILNQAQSLQKLGSSSFQLVIGVGNLFSKTDVTSTNNYLLILGHGQNLMNSVLDTYNLGDQLYLGLLGKEPVDVKAVTSALRVNLVTISEKLSQIQLSIGQINLPFGYKEKIDLTNLNQQINLLKSQITLALPVLDLVENIGSNQSIQRYVVIVQDTNELRPTGGFISSYGLITLDQGKIIDFQIDSSLSLDRLIEGKIDPPVIVKQLLGQTNWSFHDSNLDADFANSAKQMSWFYQRFKNANIDGVIGVNLSFLVNLLEQTGSIILADGQSVSADNLVSLASNPTASKGLDVITALNQVLAKKLVAADISFAQLSRTILKSVAFGEINFWFTSPKLESLAEGAGVSGRVKPQDCHPQLAALNCVADTIFLDESNMSVNKLNYYLRRNQNILAEIGPDGGVNYTLGYDYNYPVPVPNNITGNYKSYYQLYLPSSSQSLTISLDGQNIDPASFIQTSIGGLVKVEFSANLLINQNHRLEVKFLSPNHLNFQKQLLPYTLAILKQPGTGADTLTVKIRYPENLVAKSMTVPLKQNSAQELMFQTTHISQENLGIIFKNQSL